MLGYCKPRHSKDWQYSHHSQTRYGCDNPLDGIDARLQSPYHLCELWQSCWILTILKSNQIKSFI